MAATDFVQESQLDSLTTTIATAVKGNTTATATAQSTADTALTNAATAQATADNHITDTADAHDASAISIIDTGAHYTATNVEDALAEVKIVADSAAGGGVSINDGVTNTTNAWSGQKITDDIAAAVSGLIDAAPGALDTLNELAAAIGDDAAFSTTVTTALSLRVRVDAAQAFTAPQQLQGRTNLGVVSSTVDFAANFTAALV